MAVDLLDNDTDGLGAARHYFHAAPTFTRFKAEMDCLPFMPEQFDVVIFNASFHYSEDYTRTLEEALRCLRRGGHLIVADSPFYRKEESGQKMLQEKRAAFARQYGFRSDSIQSREYLTAETLKRLAVRLHLKWQIYKPWYGINWAFRPIKAKLTTSSRAVKILLASRSTGYSRMSTLISISTPSATIARSELEAHRVRTLPILVISPHNQCDCHCVMCDIWKIREAEEFSVADLERQITAFRELGVSWVVFTGGEPQKNRHLPALAKTLRAEGIRVTLLTAGLLLKFSSSGNRGQCRRCNRFAGWPSRIAQPHPSRSACV